MKQTKKVIEERIRHEFKPKTDNADVMIGFLVLLSIGFIFAGGIVKNLYLILSGALTLILITWSINK